MFHIQNHYFFSHDFFFKFFIPIFSNFLRKGTWKHVYLQLSRSTQEGISWHNWKIVNWNVKNQYKQNGLIYNRFVKTCQNLERNLRL